MENADKLFSLEAEAAVLGSCIVGSDEGCINTVIPILPDPDFFFKPEHQDIYAALLRLQDNKQPTDAVTLRAELKRAGKLEAIGGVDYIGEILDSVPHAANAVYYAGIVRERYRYRGLVDSLEKMQNILTEPLGIDEQTQQIQDIALAIETGKLETEFFTVAAEAASVAAGMREHQETLSTGFRNIDKIIGGFAPGELCILAGRPSMGKSALALDIALNMARAGKSVLFFTLEMFYRDLIERAICNLAGVNLAVVKGELPQPALEAKTREAAKELEALDLVLHVTAMTPEKQIAFIRQRQKTHKVDAVVIDYIQLMSTSRRAESRLQEVSSISRKLKLASIREGVPIIALSQLNREVESRPRHRPRMSDLRETGALEQDADIVMLLHREDYYRLSEDPGAEQDGEAELIIAKNRRGPVGTAKLVFMKEKVKFGDRSCVPVCEGEYHV